MCGPEQKKKIKYIRNKNSTQLNVKGKPIRMAIGPQCTI